MTVSFTSFARAQEVGESTNLPIPRFVSLKSDSVRARTGPGTRYPIRWIYQRKGLPVEVVQEFDTWRKIRDIDGEEGWVHQSFLSGRRYGIFNESQALPIVKRAKEDAATVALLEPNVQLRLDECRVNGWCRVVLSDFRGWIHSKHLWGVYEGEQIQ